MAASQISITNVIAKILKEEYIQIKQLNLFI
jgi:hypothetical protein